MRKFCKLLMCFIVMIGTSVAYAGVEESLDEWAKNHDSNLLDLPEEIETIMVSLLSDLAWKLQQQDKGNLQEALDEWADAHETVNDLLTFQFDDDIFSLENMLTNGSKGWVSGVVCQPGGYMPAGETECKRCKVGFACPGGLFYVDKIYTTDRGIVECENGSNTGRTACNTGGGAVEVASSTASSTDEDKNAKASTDTDKITNLSSGVMVDWDKVASVGATKGGKVSKVAMLPVERSSIGSVQQHVATQMTDVAQETDAKRTVYQRSARAVPERIKTKGSVRAASGSVAGSASRGRNKI